MDNNKANEPPSASSKAESNSSFQWFLTGGGIIAALAAAVSVITPILFQKQNPITETTTRNANQTSMDTVTWIWILAAMIAIVIGVAISSTIYSFRQSFLRREQLKKIQNQEKLAAKDALELKKIWALNQERLDYYHDIAIAQSRQSFISSQIAMSVGFALIISIGWMAAHATSIAGSIASGAVGIVGGGLSAFIGATYMKSQAAASAQLRQFFLHPVEFSRVIGAERLAVNLEGEQKAEAINNIITEMMNPDRTAQTMDEKGE